MDYCKNLILHVGFGKTGSSAIQSFLASCNRELEDHEYMYPISNNNPASVNHISSGNGQVLRAFLESYIDEYTLIKHYLFHNFKYTIISSETLQLNRENLIKLRNFVSKFKINLKIIAFVRNIVPHAISVYHQIVKRKDYYRDLVQHYEILKKRKPASNHINLSKLFSELKFNFTLLHYDTEKKDLIRSFCEKVGIQFNLFNFTNRKVNRSLNQKEIECLLKINEFANKSGLKLKGFISDDLVNYNPNKSYELIIPNDYFEYLNEGMKEQIYEFNSTLGKENNIHLSIGNAKIIESSKFNTSLDVKEFRNCCQIFLQKYKSKRISKFNHENVYNFGELIKGIEKDFGMEIQKVAKQKFEVFINLKSEF